MSLKKIPLERARPGVYVADLGRGWLSHDFVRNSFPIDSEQMLRKLQAAGIREIVIDTDKGIDPDAATAGDAGPSARPAPRSSTPPAGYRLSASEERLRAESTVREASEVIHRLFQDVRLGKQLEVEAISPVAEKIVASIERNKDALVSLARIKTKDTYTFMHSVSVSGLLVSFGLSRGWDGDRLQELAIGGLLHDIGKMLTPDQILNKPGRLDDAEMDIMKDHVRQSEELLQDTPGLTENMYHIIMQHHERQDGSGYPRGLRGDQLSEAGAMSAIVDVYDALTSVRVYKSAWEPTSTLKKMLEWSDGHFDRQLVQEFIRCLGIYPVGTLVETTSGRVGLVMEQNPNDLTRPRVKFFYHVRNGYLKPHVVDLSKNRQEVVEGAVSADRYRLDASLFL